MPTYDFRCRACDHKFTKLVPLAEREHVQCPVCGAMGAQQLFTGFLFAKKGAGGEAAAAPSSCGKGGCGGCSGC